jgi:uncharacterized protein YcaQ
VRDRVAVPVAIGAVSGDWFAHSEVMDAPFRPRTTLLSPFDAVISNRERTEDLFGFRFRLEIYVPKARREFGYFVLPILHGDRLVGRIDPLFDRKAGVLRINAVHAEPESASEAGPAIGRAIGELARWLGAREVEYRTVAAVWKGALRRR